MDALGLRIGAEGENFRDRAGAPERGCRAYIRGLRAVGGPGVGLLRDPDGHFVRLVER